MCLAQYKNLEQQNALTEKVAEAIGLNENTVRKKLKILIKKNYLSRVNKSNGQFGFIYSIPEKYQPSK